METRVARVEGLAGLWHPDPPRPVFAIVCVAANRERVEGGSGGSGARRGGASEEPLLEASCSVSPSALWERAWHRGAVGV